MWKKEAKNIADSLYVDIFANSGNEKQFNEWNEKLTTNFCKHRFGPIEVMPNKSNETANMLRMKGNWTLRNKMFPLNIRCKTSMELYTQSLMFAEIGTEQVSLAFENRSACFFNLKMYDKCLIDIGFAMEVNLSDELMTKLKKRKEACMRLMHTQEVQKRKYDKLDFPADDDYPCMANVVTIKRTNEFGRLLEAKCDIEVRKTVLVEESFVTVMSLDLKACCFTCLKMDESFVPCSQCTDVVFCDNDCMDRNSIHKLTCGTFFHRLPANIRLPLQSVLVAVDTIPNANDLIDFVEENLKLDPYAIPTNLLDARRKYAMFLKLNVITGTALDTVRAYQVYTSLLAIPSIGAIFDSVKKQRFLMHLIGQHMAIRRSNSFGNNLMEADQLNVKSLSCISSLINHSCAPNVVNFAVDNREVCVTLRPIKKGEQLFISYVSIELPTTTLQRQTFLKRNYGFEYNCERCKPSDLQQNVASMMMADTFLQRCQQYYHADKIVGTKQIDNLCIDFLNKFGHLPWSEEIGMAVKVLHKMILDS